MIIRKVQRDGLWWLLTSTVRLGGMIILMVMNYFRGLDRRASFQTDSGGGSSRSLGVNRFRLVAKRLFLRG